MMKTALAAFAVLLSATASAHKASDSYLFLRPSGEGAAVEWHLALRDLHRELVLDSNGDGAITRAELRQNDARITGLATGGLALSRGESACALRLDQPLRTARHSDGSYAVLSGQAKCAGTGALSLSYSLFFASDPQHRSIVRAGAAESARSFVLSASNPTLGIDLAAPSAFAHFAAVVSSGAEHIFSGLDHLLFLFALLLPSVLRRNKEGSWEAATGFRSVAFDVLRIVSAFTLAHSLTLSASAVGLLALPSRVVESAIAISVVFAALNNVFPVVRDGRWMAAFALGLLHGFGFSSSLAETGLTGGGLWVTLVGFNVGVELGQLFCVALFLPFAFALRSSFFYRRVLLLGGSTAIFLVACLWFAQRAFDVQLSFMT